MKNIRLHIKCLLIVFLLLSTYGYSAVTDYKQLSSNLRKLQIAEKANMVADAKKSGKTLAAKDFEFLDNKYLEKAREIGKGMAQDVKEIFKKAGVPEPSQSGTNILSDNSRGILGDIDYENMNAKDFQKVVKAAKELGYTIEPDGDSYGIKECKTTFFRSPDSFPSKSGETADIISRASSKETSMSHEISDPHLKCLDNLKKAGGTLTNDWTSLQEEELIDIIQEASKMTSRNLKAVNVDENDPFYKQLVKMKEGLSPEAAEIVNPNANQLERESQLKAFQDKLKQVNKDCYQTTRQVSDDQIKSLENTISGNDPIAAKNAKDELLIRKTAIQANKESVVQIQGGETIQELEGKPLKKILVNDSEVRFVDNQGNTMTQSQVDEMSLRPGRKDLAQTFEQNAATSVQGSKLIQGAGLALGLYGLYYAQQEGFDEAINRMEAGDSVLKTMTLGSFYTCWNLSGIPGALKTGQQAGNESMDQYIKDLQSGKDPSLVWAKIRGSYWGVERMFLGGVNEMLFSGINLRKDYQYAKDADLQYQEMRARVDTVKKYLELEANVEKSLPKAPNGDDAFDLAKIDEWKKTCLELLDPEKDPARIANREEARAKADSIREGGNYLTCTVCKLRSVHWWCEGTHWQCPNCEKCVFITDLLRGDGKSYGDYAKERVETLYQKRKQIEESAKKLIAIAKEKPAKKLQ
ncbi:MAG: hypothetical protein HQM08_19070 [Candidatus Riflebacteria bacterium]|nr:hypothetical protein [Candidatus Riflebacteria bacterium]